MDELEMIDLQRSSRKPVEKGVHLVAVMGVEKRITRSGNSSLRWVLQIVDAADPDVYRQLYVETVIVPNARWKLDRLLDALKAPTSGKAKPTDFVGLRLWVKVDHEEWNGQIRAVVTDFYAEDDPNRPEPSYIQEGSSDFQADFTREEEGSDFPF